MGKLRDSQEMSRKALTTFEEVNNERGVSITKSEIGYSYLLLGEFESSLNNLKEAVEIQKRYEMNFSLSITYVRLAQVYYEQAEFDRAEDYLERSIRIRETNPNWLENLSRAYYNMFKVKQMKEETSEASNFLSKIQNLFDRTNNPLIEQLYHLAKSLYNRDVKSKFEQDEVINALRHTRYTGMMDYELRVDLDCILSNILLSNLLKVKEEPVVAEVRTYINNLENLQKQEKSHLLYAETMSLQGLLAKAEEDPNKSRSYFDKAIESVEQNHLDRVAWTYKFWKKIYVIFVELEFNKSILCKPYIKYSKVHQKSTRLVKYP